MEHSDIIIQTPDYIQALQAQIAQMKTDDTKGLFLIDKKTLEKLVKVLSRDETLRHQMREKHREKNPELKTRVSKVMSLTIKPVMLIQ
jgi:hypothetical protein